MQVSPRLLKLMNFWPPFWAAGIRVKHVVSDLSSVDVEMRLRFWNRNVVGTQFGGSLYAMTDPFYMLMLLHHLGKDYVVWDKAATIRFKKPGRGTVRARFSLTELSIQTIKLAADQQDKYEPTFIVQVTDENGEIISEVEKVLYVKRKDKISKNKSIPHVA